MKAPKDTKSTDKKITYWPHTIQYNTIQTQMQTYNAPVSKVESEVGVHGASSVKERVKGRLGIVSFESSLMKDRVGEALTG